MNDNMLNDDRPDFTPLRPSADAARFDAVVTAITRDAMAARAHRAPRPGVARELVRWSRPALVAAAIVLAVVVPALVHDLAAHAAPAAASLPATDALGIPRRLALILHSTRDPSLAELHAAVLGDAP